eukprot:COSAG01_NODE_8282_length_2845_cov_6.455572_1_plen_149_part_00
MLGSTLPPCAPSCVGPPQLVHAPAPTIINNHHHYPQDQGVGRMIENVVHDTTHTVGRALAAGAITTVVPVLATRIRKPKPKPLLEPRPAEARGGDSAAPAPGTDEGQLPAGADEPTRPPPPPTNYQAQLAIFMRELDTLAHMYRRVFC